MKILCLYPGMDIRVNDNAHALVYLARQGVSLCVICSKVCGLKSFTPLPDYEEMAGIPVHRLYSDFPEQASHPTRHYDQVRDIAQRFKPDLIFCSQQFNMPIATRLKRAFDLPIVLLVEYAYDSSKLLKRKWHLGLKCLASPVGDLYWRWLSQNTRAIVTSYVGDCQHINYLERYGTPIYYIPWCNHIPEEVAARDGTKDPGRAIYVGSLSPWKNTDEFLATLPIILAGTRVREFVIVGPGPGVDAVRLLQKQFGDRIRYTDSLPRIDALTLIQDSFFSYTPVKAGGWGFIGDSWGVMTPLIATHNEYELQDKKDTLIVNRIQDIHLAIHQLYDSPELYRQLQEGGLDRYRRSHTAQSVGSSLLRVFESALNHQRR